VTAPTPDPHARKMTKGARSMKPGIQISGENLRGLKLCIAGAWLFGSISRGRAHELARALGMTGDEIDNLKFVEERAAEREHENGK
jgi:hypothetical protein